MMRKALILSLLVCMNIQNVTYASTSAATVSSKPKDVYKIVIKAKESIKLPIKLSYDYPSSQDIIGTAYLTKADIKTITDKSQNKETILKELNKGIYRWEKLKEIRLLTINGLNEQVATQIASYIPDGLNLQLSEIMSESGQVRYKLDSVELNEDKQELQINFTKIYARYKLEIVPVVTAMKIQIIDPRIKSKNIVLLEQMFQMTHSQEDLDIVKPGFYYSSQELDGKVMSMTGFGAVLYLGDPDTAATQEEFWAMSSVNVTNFVTQLDGLCDDIVKAEEETGKTGPAIREKLQELWSRRNRT